MRGLFLLALLPGCAGWPHDSSAHADAAVRQHQQVANDYDVERATEDQATANELAVMNEKAVRAQTQANLSDLAEAQAKSAKAIVIADWKGSWGRECAANMNYVACATAPEQASEADKALCYRQCEETLKIKIEMLAENAIASCIEAEGEPKCGVELPATAADRYGRPVASDVVAKSNKECAEACVLGRAKMVIAKREKPKAAAAGESLVLGYKRCMLATDTGQEAEKYRRFDSVLYRDLMTKTNTRCRSANRCDWLEQYSEIWRCKYGG